MILQFLVIKSMATKWFLNKKVYGHQLISGGQKISGTQVVYGNQIVSSRKSRKRQRITCIKPVKKEQTSRANTGVVEDDPVQQRQPPVKNIKMSTDEKIASPATTNRRSFSQNVKIKSEKSI